MSTKVTFNTTPSGANVEIRDRTGAPWARHITPFTVHLENGTWFFNISKHGYRTRNFAKTFYYPEGHTLSMHEVLEKEDPVLEPIHNYTVTTVPSGATVQILKYRTDTVLHTGISPTTFRLRRGNYDKNIIKSGFRTVRATFIAYKDETRNITLLPLDTPILTTLEVVVNVAAEITVISSDGRKQTVTGTRATFKIPRGRTQITARAEGYGAYSITRDVKKLFDTVHITLEPSIGIPPFPPREPPIRIPELPPRDLPKNWLEENKTLIIIVAIVFIIIILLK